MGIRIQEKAVQAALRNYYAEAGYVVKREVITPVGFIDLILYREMGRSSREKVLVEVKEWSGIKHAIGQLLSYEQYHSDSTELRLIYFTRNGQYKGVESIHQTDQLKRQHPKLTIEFVNNLIPIDTFIPCQPTINQNSLDSTSSLSQTSQNLIDILIPQDELAEYPLDLWGSTGTPFDKISF
ncbi:hypothetical protein [Chroococcidiopsis sp.]|uniref:hypothetical protein n=1 Tax=Chroococcidiopsis sp. TaxID=3088168 RepID=UPI003F2F9237